MADKMAAGILALAAKLLSFREHSRYELKQKLQRRQFDLADIDKALHYLHEKGLQSDRRFCEAYIRQQGTRFGDFRLRMELEKRGVEDDDIAGALDAADLPPEAARAHETLTKKYPQGIPQGKINTARRFLSGRGFNQASIRHALAALDGKDD